MLVESSRSLSPISSLSIDFSKTSLDKHDGSKVQQPLAASGFTELTPRTSRRLFAEPVEEEEHTPINEWAVTTKSTPSAPTFGVTSSLKNNAIAMGSSSTGSLVSEKPFKLPTAPAPKRARIAKSGSTILSPRNQENVAPPANAHYRFTRSGSVSSLDNKGFIPPSFSNLSNPLNSPTKSPSNKKTKLCNSLDDLKEYDPDRNFSPTKWTAAKLGAGFKLSPAILPTVSASGDICEISPTTMWKLCCGEFPQVTRYVVIDARFPYEFNGGHIKNALNVYQPEDLDSVFQIDGPSSINKFGVQLDPHDPKNASTAIIFHCEFSSHRGPKLARRLRSMDRAANQDNYPQLYYPQVFILQGGYRSFFNSNTEHHNCCEPMAYMPMDHPDYVDEMKMHLKKLRERATTSLLQPAKRSRSASVIDTHFLGGRATASTPNLSTLTQGLNFENY